MARQRLTFACELDAARLTALFANGAVLEELQALDGRVALMLSDFTEARAAVVRQLNATAIPVAAVPLMPYADGYYFTVENASRTRARYDEWKAWTARHSLAWNGVDLDIEPEALWASAHPWHVLGGAIAAAWIMRRWRTESR